MEFSPWKIQGTCIFMLLSQKKKFQVGGVGGGGALAYKSGSDAYRLYFDLT